MKSSRLTFTKQSIEPNLTARQDMLACSLTASIFTSGQIVPPEDVDVIMVAPKGPGHTVRSEYTMQAEAFPA